MKSHASMNRIFRTIWSAATQSWQAVPETAKSKGGSGSSSTASAVTSGILAQVALGMMVGSGAAAQAPPALTQLPTGALVVRGNASISQSATAQAAAMTVRQSSQKAVINWNTFNLGQAASINFAQPNAQAVTLNRVLDNNPSQIFGRITAPGQVFITNANGVYFAPTSSVDVGSLVATTHSISDDNFMAGKSLFERNGATGQVLNEGHITADLNGYVALLAPEVRNSGVVLARAGAVVMAAGESITLNFEGGGNLLGITTTPSTIATLIENRQAVQAPGGLIILSAVAADKMRAGVIKNTGSLEASSLVSQGGKILLEGDSIQLSSTSVINATGATGGGTVLVGGDWQGSGNMRQASQVVMDAGATIDASATVRGDGGKVVLWSDVTNANGQTWANGRIKAEAGPSGGNGGQIETSGHFLNVDGIQVSTNAAQGGAGNWLLDPYDINISSTGTDVGVSTVAAATTNIKYDTLNAALVNGSVTLQAGAVGDGGSNAGNITLYPGFSEIPAYRTLSLIAPGEIKTDSSVTNEYPAIASIFFTGLTSVLRLSSGSATPSGKLFVSLNRTGMIYNEGAGLLEIQTKYPVYNKEIHISSGTLKFSSSTGEASLYGESYYANTIYISDGATLLNPSFSLAPSGGSQSSQVIAANGATLAYDTVQPNGYGPGTILLNGNLTLKSTTPTITLGSVISGTGGLTITGGTSAQGSTVVMNPGNSAFVTHANTYTGTTTIDPNNTLQYGPTGAYGSWGSLSAGPVVNNGTLAFGLSAGVTIPNAISGTGAVSGTSTSRVTLSGALSYTGASSGGLYVAGPTLATPTVSGAGTSQPTVSVTIPDGTALGTLTQTFTPTSSTGQVTGATVTTTLTSSSTGMAANGSNWTYTPTLTASGNLTYSFTVTKTGSGLAFNTTPSSLPVATTAVVIAALTNAQVRALTAAEVAAMTTAQVAALTTAQVAAMTTAQVAAMTTRQVAAMTTAQVAAMTTTQVPAMTTAQVAAMTTTQVAAMTTAQVASMTTAQVAAMTTSQVAAMTATQVPAMTTAQVAVMTTAQVAAMTTTQVAAMTTAQVASMTTAQVAAMTTSQVAAMTSAQVPAMTTAQVAVMTTAQVAAMTTAQVASMTTAQVAAMTTAQVPAMSTAQVAAMTTAQVTAMTTAQVTSMTTAQVAAITAVQVPAMTIAQVAAMTTAQVAAMTTAQVAVLSATQLGALVLAQASALTALQVAALTTTQLGAMTSIQMSTLTAAQSAALSPAQVLALIPSAANAAVNTPEATAAATSAVVRPPVFIPVATAVPSMQVNGSGLQIQAPSSAQMASPASAPVAVSAAPTANAPATSANAEAPASAVTPANANAPAGNPATTVASAAAPVAGAEASGNNAAAPVASPQAASAPVASSTAPTANAPATSANARATARDAAPTDNTTVASTSVPATSSGAEASGNNSVAPTDSQQAASAPVANSAAPTANTTATSANAPEPARDASPGRDAAPAGNTTVASAPATGADADASGNNAAVPAGSPQGASAPFASSAAPTANTTATSASSAAPGRDATPAGSAANTVASSEAPIGNATPSASNSSTANSSAPVGNSSTGTSGAASTSLSIAVSPNKVVAVKVNVVRAANAQSGGVVTVAVPKGTAGTNAEFAIPVPIQVLNASTTTNQEIKISLVNNAPAPSWVKYSPETKSLLASAMPAKSLPIKLIVTVGNYRTMVELLETTKR